MNNNKAVKVILRLVHGYHSLGLQKSQDPRIIFQDRHKPAMSKLIFGTFKRLKMSVIMWLLSKYEHFWLSPVPPFSKLLTCYSILYSSYDVCSCFVIAVIVLYCVLWPSVLWRCWLGGRKGIRPVKNWVVRCWRRYLSGARCRLAYGPADATAIHCLLLQ